MKFFGDCFLIIISSWLFINSKIYYLPKFSCHYWNDFLPQSNFGKKGLFSKDPLLK